MGEDGKVRRSPCRERGLKYAVVDGQVEVVLSLPVQGAWIEMRNNLVGKHDAVTSLPVQGAWIEIFAGLTVSVVLPVAPRAGSVD